MKINVLFVRANLFGRRRAIRAFTFVDGILEELKKTGSHELSDAGKGDISNTFQPMPFSTSYTIP